MAYAFANNLTELQAAIGQRRGQAANNLFQTLANNRVAAAQMQQAKQQRLNNVMELAQLVTNARSARARQAAAQQQHVQDMSMALLREAGIDRRAREAQEANAALQLGSQRQARRYRQEDLDAAREDRNLKIALDLIGDQAVPPEAIGIPLTDESRSLLKSQYKTLATHEAEGNKQATQIADALNATLAHRRDVADSLQEIYEDADLDERGPEVAARIAEALADSGVVLPVTPRSKSAIPGAINQIMQATVDAGKKEAGSWATFDPQTFQFQPVIRQRYRLGGPLESESVSTPSAATGEIDDFTLQGARLVSLFRAQGMDREAAKMRAAHLMRDPVLRVRAQELLDRQVPHGTE